MGSLEQRSIRPGAPRLSREQLDVLLAELPGWRLDESGRVSKRFGFDDYRAAVAFANRVAELAIRDDHHPDLLVSYGAVTVSYVTHDAAGVTENDAISAARVERLAR